MKNWWIKRVQLQDSITAHHERTKVALNLQENVEGLLECREESEGSIQFTYLQREIHEEIGGASARRDATWWCWFDHGSSERRLLGTKAQTVGKVDSNGLLGL